MQDKSIIQWEHQVQCSSQPQKTRREQGTEVREGEVCIDHVLCCSVRISRRDTLDENLGLVEIKVEDSVLLEYMLDVQEQL